MELLIRDHLDDPRIAEICEFVSRHPSAPAEKLLTAVVDKCRDREVRGLACFDLARLLMATREIALKPWFEREKKTLLQASLITSGDPSYFRYIKASDTESLRRAVEALLERAIREYGEIVYWRDPSQPGRQETLAQAAQMYLNLFRMAEGTLAPEIEGKDVDGKPMKLSDYRGRAVVLIFWGTWCPGCMEMVPHERSLAERLEGKPFVLLGINGDENREQAKRAIQKERMTWRSWSDGKPPGPIPNRWGVRR